MCPDERQRFHYEIECKLADRLREADREERAQLYAQVYDELFQLVPDHPQLVAKVDPAQRALDVAAEARIVERFSKPGDTILEIGAGDCALSHRLARRAGRVIAVDVSEVMTDAETRPDNLEVQLTSGCSIPVEDDAVDVAYSNQLLEHLHPEDAAEHARDVARTLRAGGVYIVMTPARLTGPHDISAEFGDVTARGFHLKEYSTRELVSLFRDAGFRRIAVFVKAGSLILTLPAAPIALLEDALAALPRRWGRPVARHTPLRKVLGRVVAYA